MSERPVSLDVHAGLVGTRSGHASPGDPRRDARADDVDRFAHLLADAAPEPVSDARSLAAMLPAGPMDLLRSQADRAATAVPQDALLESLQGEISRLLVGDGSDGRRSVRLDLADELMPGASVAVFEEAGAWTAEFICRDQASFEVLAEAAPDMARRLADALVQDAVWRVRLDPDDPARTVEACASAIGDGAR